MKASFLALLSALALAFAVSTITANANSPQDPPTPPPPPTPEEWPTCPDQTESTGNSGSGYLSPTSGTHSPSGTLAEAQQEAIDDAEDLVKDEIFDFGNCPDGSWPEVNVNAAAVNCTLSTTESGNDLYFCLTQASYRWVCCSYAPVPVTF